VQKEKFKYDFPTINKNIFSALLEKIDCSENESPEEKI
jgi:hypothetical protein